MRALLGVDYGRQGRKKATDRRRATGYISEDAFEEPSMLTDVSECSEEPAVAELT